MDSEFEGLKQKRKLTYDEMYRICRITGSVTGDQAHDIAYAIFSVQSGNESISEWYERFCKESEEFED